MSIIYYTIITVIAVVGFFLIKKHFDFFIALIISLLSYILLCMFPLVVFSLGIVKTMIFYSLVIVAASVGLVIFMPQLSNKYEETTVDESLETANFAVRIDNGIKNTIEDDGSKEEKFTEDALEENIVVKENVVEEETFDEQIPENSSYAGITRSVIAEEEIQIEIEKQQTTGEQKMLEEPCYTEEQQVPGDKEKIEEVLAQQQIAVSLQEEQQETPEQAQEKILQPEVQDKQEIIDEPVKLMPGELISMGLASSRNGDYNEAIKLLLEALEQQPESMLKYIAVSEISTIYQQMGMYFPASNIISAYINQRDLQEHPGLKVWRNKLVFLTSITKLLKENKLPNLPYHQLPDFVKKKAFAKCKELSNI